jgi:tRNA dimethylallyltransferase
LPDEGGTWMPTVTLGLRLDRGELVPRLDARAAGMWRDGLLDEVAALEPHGLGTTASRAIGYAQALAQLHGEIDEATAIEQTAALTRRYARRQVSWFRRDTATEWLEAGDPENAGLAARRVADRLA